MNLPLDPSLVALVQALQAVQNQGIQSANFPPSHSAQGARHARQPQHASSQTDIHGALFQILQQSSGSANIAPPPPPPQPQYHGYSSESMNSFLDQFTDYNHGAPNQHASGSSSMGSGAAAVASTSTSSPPSNADEGFDDKRRRNTAASGEWPYLF